VQETDPTFVRKLKIEIMTLLSNSTNIDRILREFSYYTTKEEKEFVTGTIQAIGKCAMRIPEVLDRCMIRLLQLLTLKSPAVVAESVVVIKQLLQLPENVSEEAHTHNDDVVKQLTRLFSKVENPKAKAAIIWVVGEYLDKVGKYAPDILRQLAKDFIILDDTVKLQVMNLSAKLMVKNPDQSALISQYIFNLAKYDANYDIRDRGRLLRHLLFNQNNIPLLSSRIKELFITTKPSPVPPSYDMRFMVGSLAQTIGQTTPCYNSLPDWSEELQNSGLRKTAEPELPVFNRHISIGPTTTDLGNPNNRTTVLSPSGSNPQREYAPTDYESWLNGEDQQQPPEEGYDENEYDYDPNYQGDPAEYDQGWDGTDQNYEGWDGYDQGGYDEEWQEYEGEEGHDYNENYNAENETAENSNNPQQGYTEVTNHDEV
jgi:AP-3 complex subunit beta